MTFGNRAHSARGASWRRAAGGVLAAALACFLSRGVSAQPDNPDISRPQSAKRLVHEFTFEEPENPYPVPNDWFRAQDDPMGVRRPGFPMDNKALFDRTTAFSGTTSVRLPTRGGSVSLRLKPGALPIFPDADYSVSARVHTADIRFGRAFLTARLLDQRLHPIPGSEVRSEPALSPNGWQTLRVLVKGTSGAAAWLQIDLELLQPVQFELPPPPGVAAHIVRREDVSGSAYFDDVAIALVPRTRFWTEQPSGLYVGKEPPTLGMLARDEGGEPLQARVRVVDIDGRIMAQDAFPLDPSARPVMWTPKLAGYGWFRAIMEIDAAGINVNRSELWLCVVPETPTLSGATARSDDLARFGIVADSVPESLLMQVTGIVERVRGRFVTLSAFDPATPAGHARAALIARSPVIQRLLDAGQEITLALAEAPPELAAGRSLDPTDVLGLCEQDSTLWAPLLEPTLDVFGQRLLRYQLGRTSDLHAMRRDPGRGLAAFESTVARLVPGPRIVLPWRADHSIPLVERPAGTESDKPGRQSNIAEGPLVDGMTMVFPSGFAPAMMGELGRAWREQAASGNPFELTVVPELPDTDLFGPRARAVEMARRTAEFWAALSSNAGAQHTVPPARLALNAPWKIVQQGHERMLLPAPELAVMMQMAQKLAGRRVVAAVPAAPGIRAMLLAEPTGTSAAGIAGRSLARACVIAWDDGAESGRAWIDVYPTGDHVGITDMFGNTSRLEATSAVPGAGTIVRVPLTDAPIIVEGVDPYLSQFTSSFRLTPRFIPSVVVEHEIRVEMTNPWPMRITGQIQVKEAEEQPGNASPRSSPWTILPNVMEFAIGPGESVSLPATLSFGPGQLAGTRDLALVARVMADRQYPAIRSTTTVELGLPELELAPEAQLGPTSSGPDVIVLVAVTNKDTRPRTMHVELAAKGTPARQIPISDLPPSQTIYKRIVIPGGAKLLAGRHVRVTLSDDDSAARLSKAVLVPDPR
jgi:hypothetical protein